MYFVSKVHIKLEVTEILESEELCCTLWHSVINVKYCNDSPTEFCKSYTCTNQPTFAALFVCYHDFQLLKIDFENCNSF